MMMTWLVFQLSSAPMSLIELTVPINVNFVRFKPKSSSRYNSDYSLGWSSEAVDARQKLTFAYTTRGSKKNEWTTGIPTLDDTPYKGRLYLRKIIMSSDSKLHIYFKSEVMFSGCYERQVGSMQSQVVHSQNPKLNLQLNLLDLSSCSQREWEIVAYFPVCFYGAFQLMILYPQCCSV